MIRRRLVALSLVALLGVALVAIPATAHTSSSSAAGTPEKYAADASGSAFKLNLLGTELSVGSTSVSIDSSPKATATGTGALLAGTAIGGSSASSPLDGATVAKGIPDPKVCGPLSLPASIPVVGLLTACSYVQTNTAGGAPSSKAYGGSVDTLAVGTGSLLGTGQPLAALGDALNGLVTQVGGLLNQLPPPLGGQGGVLSPLPGLLSLLTTGQGANLISAQLGTNTSQASVTDGAISADSSSVGVKLCVLEPVPGTCLITITVGTAKAAATCDRGSYVATPTVDPAAVKIEVFPMLFDALTNLPGAGDLLKNLFPTSNGTPTLTLQAGQTIDLPLPAPLNSTIVASSGSTTKTATGASASAASLELDLLKGLPGGGISLALSQAQAGVSCAAAVPGTTTTTTKPKPTPNKLAFTGDTPWRPVVGAFFIVLAVGGLEITRRARRGATKADASNARQ